MAKRCSYCHEPPQHGLASVYWAWYPARDERVAYVSKLCVGCLTEIVVPLMAATPLERLENDDDTCALCGTAAGEYPFYIYATVFMPGREQIPVEGLLCEGCDVQLIARIREGSKRLPDRNAGERARSASDSVWNLLAG